MTCTRSRIAMFAFGMSLLLGAGACGPGGAAGGGDGAGEAGAGDGASSASGSTASAADDPDATEPEPSPLDEFFGGSANPRDEREEELEKTRQVEQLIVTCMTAEGFEYVAVDPATAMDPFGFAEFESIPADEFAERYGYGMTTIDVEELADRARQADPNEAIINGLSPDGQRAYQEALWGAAAAAEKYGEQAPANADANPGCRPEAERTVFGDREKGPVPAEFNAVFEEMQTLDDRILQDPRVAEAATTWADCMADAGHPELGHPDDAREEISRRLFELYGAELPEGMTEGLPKSRPGLPSDAIVPAPRPRGGQEPDPAAMAELQEYEVSVAVADRGCRPAYDEVVADVRREVEQAFIDANRAALEAYRDAVALQEGGG